MRASSGVVAGALLVGAGLFAVPAAASPPPPVASIAVATSIQIPAHLYSGFRFNAVVSWTGEDPSAQGVRVCFVEGTHPTTDPSTCDVAEDVAAPASHSDPLSLVPERSYALSVFATTGSDTSEEFSTPRTTKLHASTQAGKKVFYRTYGDQWPLRANLTDKLTGAALTNQPVALWHAGPSTNGWHHVDTRRTNAAGVVEETVRPRVRGDYAWLYEGTNGELPSVHIVTIYLGYRLTARLTSTHAAPGQRVRLYGTVRPATDNKVVRLSEYTTSPCNGYVLTGQHVTAKRQQLPNGHTTFGYVMTIAASAIGTHKYQANTDTDRRLNGGTSPTATLTVGGGARGTERSGPLTPAC